VVFPAIAVIKMISIKRFLEHSRSDEPDSGLSLASSRLQELLCGLVHERDSEMRRDSQLVSKALLDRVTAASSPLDLLKIANEALEASESARTLSDQVFEEYATQMQTMVAMLTKTVADVSGQSDVAVVQLREIEQQIEHAAGLEDIRALKQSLSHCLTSVKEAAAQQRKATEATVARLTDHIKHAVQPTMEAMCGLHEGATGRAREYVAVFKLQRAEQILSRFGENPRDQMLAVIGEGLEAVQRPGDRLMRWKGPAFVMFLSSPEDIAGIRRRLSTAASRIGQRYIELGPRSALVAVGIDWVVFPQAEYPSLDVVFSEVDSFLESTIGGQVARDARSSDSGSARK